MRLRGGDGLAYGELFAQLFLVDFADARARQFALRFEAIEQGIAAGGARGDGGRDPRVD